MDVLMKNVKYKEVIELILQKIKKYSPVMDV
jgi:hypothetical protein